MFRGKPVYFPPVTWLAVGFLGICLLSVVGAASPYLGLVELSRQIKFFIVYLFAVNCVDSKSYVRVLAIVGVIMIESIYHGTMLTRLAKRRLPGESTRGLIWYVAKRSLRLRVSRVPPPRVDRGASI